MRVLHLDSGRTLRGGQRQALLLMRELAALGVEQTLLARGELLKEARAAGFAAGEFGWAKLWREARRGDVVHAHDGHSHAVAAALGRKPLVVARRVAFAVRTGAASQWTYSRAARFIAVSRAVSAELERAGVPPAKIRVIPDAVDLPAAVSTLEGPVVALAMDDPGKCGELLAALPAAVVRSRRLAADLPSARAFVYLSESEGLGSAALLAMAYGVPVVASRRGGLPEAVLDGETGVLVENRIEDVLSALEQLESMPERARAMGAAGRARAAAEFAPAAVARRTLAVYREAAAGV
jgi:glycosyltransferase involved in cell wall biosynthesis